MFYFQKNSALRVDSPNRDPQDSEDERDEPKISTASRFLDNPRTRDVGEYIKQALDTQVVPEKTRRWIPVAVGGCLVLVLGLISLFKTYHRPLHAGRDCGSTPDEARALGCVFDPMTFCWVQPECDDPELTKQFFGYQNWRYWRHINGTDEVSQEEAAKGDDEFYTTWEYHLVHCAYCYKKVHRAVLGNGFIDSHLGSYHHTSHCASVAAWDNITLDTIIVKAPLHFTTCNPVTYDVDKMEV